MSGEPHEWAAAPFTERDFYRADPVKDTTAATSTSEASVAEGAIE